MHMHTEALAGRGETCRWMSAAARASGDRVLASLYKTQLLETQLLKIICPMYAYRD